MDAVKMMGFEVYSSIPNLLRIRIPMQMKILEVHWF